MFEEIEEVSKARQILNDAADLLSKEENSWIGHKYYHKPDNGNLCFCSHGAISYCGSDKMRNTVKDDYYSANWATGKITSPIFQMIDEEGERTPLNLKSITAIQKEFGVVGIAHYLACKKGLSTSWNDTWGRTKEEVIAKLREAAKQ